MASPSFKSLLSKGRKSVTGTASEKAAYRDRWKATKAGLAHAEEMGLRVADYRQRRFAKKNLFGSKVSNPGSRANPDVDQQVLKKIAHFMKFGAQVALAASKPLSVRKVGTTRRSTPTPKTYQKKVIREANSRIQLVGAWQGGKSRYKAWFQNWDHVSPLVKAMACGMSIPEGRRFAFSLKLSDVVIGMALVSKKGFAGFMQDRIARFLRKALPGHPPINFVFIIEAWHKWELPHLQGAIELDMGLPDEDEISVGNDNGEAIRDALRQAGGLGKKKQVDTTAMYEAAGWFAYLGKRRLVTERTLQQMRRATGIPALPQKESLMGATGALRRNGKRWFNEAKASGAYVLWDRRRSAP